MYLKKSKRFNSVYDSPTGSWDKQNNDILLSILAGFSGFGGIEKLSKNQYNETLQCILGMILKFNKS